MSRKTWKTYIVKIEIKVRSRDADASDLKEFYYIDIDEMAKPELPSIGAEQIGEPKIEVQEGGG